MAALQTIRDKAGLLVSIVIGLALIAFILDPKTLDAFMKEDHENVGEIFEKKISYIEFDNEVQKLTLQYEQQTRSKLDSRMVAMVKEQAWNSLIQQRVYNKCFAEVGVSVSSTELYDMINGQNVAPAIRQQFKNPETGLFDRNFLVRYLHSLKSNPDQKKSWVAFENSLSKQRLHSKFITLIKKSAYSTKLDIDNQIDKSEKNVDFSYVSIPLSTIEDKDIKISDSDLKSYFEKNKEQYHNDVETRNISYVEFKIKASDEDKTNVKQEVEKIYQEFKTAKDDIYFAKLNSDDKLNESYIHASDLPEEQKDLFNAKIGTIVGPYISNNRHVVAKLVDSKMLPDSVKIRHLFIAIKNNSKISTDNAIKKSDSLINLYKTKKTSFQSLIALYSDDPSKKENAGELGWLELSKIQRNLADSCYKLSANSVFKQQNRSGISIFQIVKKTRKIKQIKIAQIVRYIEASQETVKDVYNLASAFVTNNKDYSKYTANTKIIKSSAFNLTNMASAVNGLNDSRQLVKSAFKSENNKILVGNDGNPIFDFNDRYVVAFLTDVKSKGIPSFESLKQEISIKVKAEKKAEKIIAGFKKYNSLSDFATKENLEIRSTKSINFSSFYIPEIGPEPKLIAAVLNQDLNKLSAPIVGNGYVFLAEVTKITPSEITKEKSESYRNVSKQSRVDELGVFNALKTEANIVDNRFNFY